MKELTEEDRLRDKGYLWASVVLGVVWAVLFAIMGNAAAGLLIAAPFFGVALGLIWARRSPARMLCMTVVAFLATIGLVAYYDGFAAVPGTAIKLALLYASGWAISFVVRLWRWPLADEEQFSVADDRPTHHEQD